MYYSSFSDDKTYGPFKTATRILFSKDGNSATLKYYKNRKWAYEKVRVKKYNNPLIGRVVKTADHTHIIFSDGMSFGPYDYARKPVLSKDNKQWGFF